MIKKNVSRALILILTVLFLCTSVAVTAASAKQYADGLPVGTPVPPPVGEITYTGIIGPNSVLSTVYASITGHNETAADVSGTMILKTLDQGTVTRTVTKDVTFTRWYDVRELQYDDRFLITSEYTPGESMLLTFEVGGVEVARFTHRATTAVNDTDQIFALDKIDDKLPGYIPTAPWKFNWSVTPADPCWQYPQTYGEAGIARWDGDRIGALSITIDDNLVGDHATWRRLSQYYDIPVSWILVGNGCTKNQEVTGELVSWRKNQDMGLGLQSHTYTHWADVTTGTQSSERIQMVRDEYAKSSDVVSRVAGGVVPLVVGLPGGAKYGPYNEAARPDRSMLYDYFIGGRDISSPTGGILSAGDGADFETRVRTLYDTSALIFGNHSYGGYACHYFHGVGTGLDNGGAATELRLLHENRDKVWAGKVDDILRYIGERTTASLSTVSAAPGEIRLSLSDKMHDDTYNYPLTIKVKIGEDWEGVKVTQGGNITYGTVKMVDGRKQALVKAVPDRGEIVVTACSAAEAAAGTEQPAAMSVATLYSLEYTADDTVTQTVPGFYRGQPGGEFTVTLPAGTQSVVLSSRATYAYSDIAYLPGNTVRINGQNRDVSVVVTSEDGKAQNEYIIHFVPDADAVPLVKTSLWQHNFDDVTTFSASSGDPLRFNGFYGGTYPNGFPIYADPENRTGNTVLSLNTLGSSFLIRGYLTPETDIAARMNLHFPGRATGPADAKISFADKEAIYLRWDAAAGNYKWYVGGTHTTGIYGGVIEKDSWFKVALQVESAAEGADYTARWKNSNLTVWLTKTDATGHVVTTKLSKPAMDYSARDVNNRASLKLDLLNGSKTVPSEVLIDGYWIYEPAETPALPPALPYSLTDLQCTKTAKGIGVKVNVSNIGAGPQNGTLIAAVYQGNTLITLKMKDVPLNGGASVTVDDIELDGSFTTGGSYMVRAFVWDSLSDGVPVSSAIEKQVMY